MARSYLLEFGEARRLIVLLAEAHALTSKESAVWTQMVMPAASSPGVSSNNGFLGHCGSPRTVAAAELKRISASLIRYGVGISVHGLPDAALLQAAELEVKRLCLWYECFVQELRGTAVCTQACCRRAIQLSHALHCCRRILCKPGACCMCRVSNQNPPSARSGSTTKRIRRRGEIWCNSA